MIAPSGQAGRQTARGLSFSSESVNKEALIHFFFTYRASSTAKPREITAWTSLLTVLWLLENRNNISYRCKLRVM